MVNLTKIFFILTILTVTVAAQKVSSLVYDETSGQIKAIYYIDDYKAEGNCGRFNPIVGTVIESNLMVEDQYDNSLTLKVGKKTELINFITLDLLPPHIIENIKGNLLKKGSTVKVWGLVCGSGGFTSASHIAKVESGVDLANFPDSKESILNENPQEAFKRAKLLLLEIDKKIKQSKSDFDKEIAPNISSEEKGEFETTEEANTRLTKLQNLRKANSSKLWKKIYTETNSLVNEYLKVVGSSYATPISVEIGRYNADSEQFPIFKDGKKISEIEIPRKIAPTLKQNFNKAKIFVDYGIGLADGEVVVSPQRLRIEFEGQSFIGDIYAAFE